MEENGGWAIFIYTSRGRNHGLKTYEMAKVTDATAIQFRLLNTKKGPAVRGTRTQNDKALYRNTMKHRLESQVEDIILMEIL